MCIRDRMVAAERSADGVYGRDSSKKGSSIKLVVQPGSMRFSMRPWSSSLEVKQRLREHAGGLVQVGWMRLFHNSRELHNGQRLIDLLPAAKVRLSLLRARHRISIMQTHPKQPRTHAAPPSLIANRSDGLIPLSAPKRGRRHDTALARHSVDAPLPRPRFDSPFAPTTLCPDRPLPLSLIHI